MSSTSSPSQKRYRTSHPSDAADSSSEAPARPAKRHRGDCLTPDSLICDRGAPVTPTRGDAAHPVAKFHYWNKERAVGPHETVTAKHELTHRNYESGTVRVSAAVVAPACTATLQEDRRGAAGPRLPQGCIAYISHERCKGTALSVLPAESCASTAFSGQIQQLHNIPSISDSYQPISKPDTVLAGRMFCGSITPDLSQYVDGYAIDYTDAYVDFSSLAPLELTTCGGYGYSYHDASSMCATLTQAQPSHRRPSSSSDSSLISTPRLSSPYREWSGSPSTIDELSSPNGDCLEYMDIVGAQKQYLPLCYNENGQGSAVAAAVAQLAVAQPNVDSGYILDSSRTDGTRYLDEWLHDCEAALVQQELQAAAMPAASTSTAQPSHAVCALPPSAFMQPQPAPPAVMPDLQHPRPRRAWLPPWQTEETEFDLKQFVKSPRRQLASPGRAAAQQDYAYHALAPFAAEMGPEDGEEEAEDQDAMEEEWEYEDDAESDQGMELEDDSGPCPMVSRHPEGPPPVEIEAGTGMGLGFSTRRLDAQSLLYQPVPDYVRCPDATSFVMGLMPGPTAFHYPCC